MQCMHLLAFSPLTSRTPTLLGFPATRNSQKIESWLYFLLNSKKEKGKSRYIKIKIVQISSRQCISTGRTEQLLIFETLIWKARQALARVVECARVLRVVCFASLTCANTNPPLFQHPSRTCWRWDWSSEWSSGVSARSRGARTASSSASRSLQVRTSPHAWTH